MDDGAHCQSSPLRAGPQKLGRVPERFWEPD
jgi:hypothetical protein